DVHGARGSQRPTTIPGACRRGKQRGNGPVHLLVRYQPKVAVSALVNSLKEVSARRLRSEFTGRVNRHITHGHLWSPSYSAASCGGAAQHYPSVHRSAKAPTRATSRLTHPEGR